MTLVAGGTGRLGELVVRRLRGAGKGVRVLTRDRSRARELVDLGVEVVVGDVRDPHSLAPALTGVSTVVSAVHGFAGPGRVSPASVDRDGNANLVSAATSGGAAVVLVSVVGAASGHPIELFRMKAEAENTLRRSGAPWTIVRATAFAELYLDLMRRSMGRSGRPLVFGRGENPINFVSVADVAAAVVAAVSDHSLRGRILEVGGPDDLTMTQLASIAAPDLRSSGREPRRVPAVALRGLAATGRLVGSALARQAAAALVMDSIDMTFDASSHRATFPQLPVTQVRILSS